MAIVAPPNFAVTVIKFAMSKRFAPLPCKDPARVPGYPAIQVRSISWFDLAEFSDPMRHTYYCAVGPLAPLYVLA